MKPWHALTLLGFCILSPGCALIADARRNMCVALSAPFEAHRENARNRRWAEQAWQKEGGAEAICRRSEDYAQGFKDGYAEHLFRGGNSEPPLVAPLRYRHIRYQNAQGYTAIEDWFAGFRHGATVARETGARRLITGPSGLHSESAPENPHDSPVQMPAYLPDGLSQKTVVPPPQFITMPLNEVRASDPVRTDSNIPGGTPIPAPPPLTIINGLPTPSPTEAPRIINVRPLAPPPTEAPRIINVRPLEPSPRLTEAPKIAESAQQKLEFPFRPAPLRVKIMKVSEWLPPTPVPAKAKITGVTVSPQPAPAPVSEPQAAPGPMRVRVRTLPLTPTKDGNEP